MRPLSHPSFPSSPPGRTAYLAFLLALMLYFGDKNSPGNGVPCSHNVSMLKRVTYTLCPAGDSNSTKSPILENPSSFSSNGVAPLIFMFR